MELRRRLERAVLNTASCGETVSWEEVWDTLVPDPPGGSTSGGANTLALPQYAAWVAAEFPPGSSTADTALSADPDRDGLDNLTEFAFKTPPLLPGGTPLAVTPAANGSPLQVTFALRNDIPGLAARIEISTNLTSWDTSESGITRLPAVPQPNGTDSITARLEITPALPRVLLRITLLL